NEGGHAVLRDAGHAREKNDSSPLAAMLPSGGRTAFAILPDRSALRRAPERRCDDGTELRLGEGLSDGGCAPLFRGRIPVPLCQISSLGSLARIAIELERN